MDNSETRNGGRMLARLGRRLPAAGWVAVGLLGAAVIAPASAVAASNLVGIVGSNGARAGVTSAGSLQTAEASPASFVALHDFAEGSCDLVYKVPRHEGLIITGVAFNSYVVPTPGPGTFTGLYTTRNCAGSYFLDNNPGGIGETTVPLSPGLALKSGTGLYITTAGGVFSDVYITGYLVSASAVPSNRLPAVARANAAQPR
jgi:hypothetical protein